MAEDGGAESESQHSSNYTGVDMAPGSAEDERSGRPVSELARQDLRSLLVTSALNLEKLDVDLFRGKYHVMPILQIPFGGEIIGQALVAAAKTVGDDFFAHSLHCYFVRAGDFNVPVSYQVDRTRDGRNFALRSVKAIQHGHPILIFQASFHVQQPCPLQHQITMPTVPPPEDVLTAEEVIQHYLSKPGIAENVKRYLNGLLTFEGPIEIKPVNPPEVSGRVAKEPKILLWVRARGHIGKGNMKLHCCVAAYISDMFLLTMLPYPNHWASSASLDHAMWFHCTFRTDEWMLYECESPWAGGSRVLTQGRLWRRDGVLAASFTQEGVLRMKAVTEHSKL